MNLSGKTALGGDINIIIMKAFCMHFRIEQINNFFISLGPRCITVGEDRQKYEMGKRWRSDGEIELEV